MSWILQQLAMSGPEKPPLDYNEDYHRNIHGNGYDHERDYGFYTITRKKINYAVPKVRFVIVMFMLVF